MTAAADFPPVFEQGISPANAPPNRNNTVKSLKKFDIAGKNQYRGENKNMTHVKCSSHAKD